MEVNLEILAGKISSEDWKRLGDIVNKLLNPSPNEQGLKKRKIYLVLGNEPLVGVLDTYGSNGDVTYRKNMFYLNGMLIPTKDIQRLKEQEIVYPDASQFEPINFHPEYNYPIGT
ncbi:MAG: hypothetical protein QXK37_05730 [Candidatus Woesearchaeota archaeon]